MYSDTIKVANKIISYDDLFEIFTQMNEKLQYYKRISINEETRNRMLENQYQNYTYKDNDSKLTFSVNFYDDTYIKFDNYNNFIGIFNSRLDEIKSIDVYFCLSYQTKVAGSPSQFYNQRISMSIYEKKASIDTSLSSEDKKIDDIYELIKRKVLTAPVKYDDIIKKKGSITTTSGFAVGCIPAIVIATLLLFIPAVRHIFAVSYVLYPICCIFLAFSIGGTITSGKFDKLYKNIVPEKKYAGYNNGAVYKDDIDKYVETSEILIGKNVNNLACRKEIKEYYEKQKKKLLPCILIILAISIITLFLGNI